MCIRDSLRTASHRPSTTFPGAVWWTGATSLRPCYSRRRVRWPLIMLAEAYSSAATLNSSYDSYEIVMPDTWYQVQSKHMSMIKSTILVWLVNHAYFGANKQTSKTWSLYFVFISCFDYALIKQPKKTWLGTLVFKGMLGKVRTWAYLGKIPGYFPIPDV